MASPSAVLLPKVFPIELVSIGQLLRNPLTPNVDTFRGGCSVVEPDDIASPPPEQPYAATISINPRGQFEIGWTRLLGRNTTSSTQMIHVEAEKLQYQTLKDTRDVFRRICASENAKAWINEMVLNKAPCYLVVGLQTVHNAALKRAVLNEGSRGRSLTIPLEATPNLPVYAQDDLGTDFGQSTGRKVTGIFGIEVQRLASRIDVVGSVEKGLTPDVSWHWAYQRVKGTQTEEEKELNILLKDITVEELVQLLEEDEQEDADDDDEDV